VEKLLAIRQDVESLEYKVLVSWRGLEISENSWEPLQVIYSSAPRLTLRFLKEQDAEDNNSLLNFLGVTA
jgi:Chromo (CHRromatin Organisation MOdifier) domain